MKPEDICEQDTTCTRPGGVSVDSAAMVSACDGDTFPMLDAAAIVCEAGTPIFDVFDDAARDTFPMLDAAAIECEAGTPI
jgi:hypothetical protein